MKPPRASLLPRAARIGTALLLAGLAAHALPAQGKGHPAPSVLEPKQEAASMLDKLGARVNPELRFTDERGYPFQLKQLFPGERPVVLNLGYYSCPSMCSQVLEGMVEGLNRVALEPGTDYYVLSVSIDPRETPEVAMERKQRFLQKFTKIGAPDGWRLVVGEQPAIQELTETVGYRYFWSEHLNQYAHPPALIFLTNDGRVSRVITNTVFDPADLRLAIVEASQGKLGTFWDQVQLNCLTFDGRTNSYSLAAMTVMRIAGVATLLAIGSMIAWMIHKERRRPVTAVAPTA